MIVGNVKGATRNLGAPPDWDPKRDGRCDSLPVRDQPHSPGVHSMVSAWFPDEGELTALQRGAPVYLTVIGITHPAVSIAVGSAAAVGERHAERDPSDPTPPRVAAAPTPDPSRRKGCLSMKIDDGELSIRIGVEALAIAVEGSPMLERGEDFVGPKVTDPDRFARELLNELEREDEDGANAIHRAFDQAAVAAIEDGAEGIRLASDEDDG